MRTRPGRTALHGAFPTSATGRPARGGVFFRRARPRPTASDTPVASSVPGARARFSSSVTLRFGGRRDRFRGGLVKGVRFTDPGCLPPAGVKRASRPRRSTSKTAPLPRRCGAHVMRIAAFRGTAPLLPPAGPRACALERRPMVRLPSARSGGRSGFRPDSSWWRASLSPRAFPPTSAIRRCTGTTASGFDSSFCEER